MNVSLICACKNRYKALRISLTSWLLCDEIKEIIIVDWSSDESLNHLTEIDPKIKIVRVENKKYFNQPQPLNLAASIATGNYILKVDVDYVFNPYYNFFDSYEIDITSFLCGQNSYNNQEITHSPYFKFLRGILYITKDNFLKVGGYNEKFNKYYAYEDDEIVKRLEIFGLEKKMIKYNHTAIHLPHSDKKRIENFEAFESEKDYEKSATENLSQEYIGKELEWQVEYAIAKQHIKENEKMIGEITNYYVKPKTLWDILKIDEQNYLAKEIGNKLEGFPKTYYVSLEESKCRQEKLEKALGNYKVYPKPILSKRFSESDDIITGKYLHQLNSGTAGCCVSHLKAIKYWYDSTDDDYAFFCEDDLSLETVEYWDFSWKDFIESLPEDAEGIQLLAIRNDFETFELRERYWNDWGATAYILTRDYAKKIIDTYIKDDTFHLEVPNCEVMPLIENILFTSLGKTYTVPLFVENIEFDSTFSKDQDDDVNAGQKNNHKVAHEIVLNYWKNKMKGSPEVNKLEELLTQYSSDTENPEKNFALGLEYEKRNHNAPALSYFLRCAERTNDNLLAYEALIHGSNCYDREGTRDGTAKGILQQALCLLPERPEAYFLLSRFSEKREWWQDCYIYADTGLRTCNFDLEPLKTDVEYPGKYGLLFEKAVSGWWWGKTEQSKNIFLDLYYNQSLSEDYRNGVIQNLIKMGVDT
jgi:hypothetical protein